MSKPRRHEIVKDAQPRSELSQFAAWFHQDWKFVFKNFREGTLMYFQSLTPERKKALRSELSAFLEAHQDRSREDLKRSWLQAGAQGWQANLDIRDTLGEFVKML